MKKIKSNKVAIICNGINNKGGTELYIRSVIVELKKLSIDILLIVPKLSENDSNFVAVNCSDVLVLDSIEGGSKSPNKIIRERQQSIAASQAILSECALVVFHCFSYNFDALAKSLAGKINSILFIHTPTFTCPGGARYLFHSDTLCTLKPGLGCLVVNKKENCISFSFNDRLPPSYLPNILTFQFSIKRFLSYFNQIIFNSVATKNLMGDIYSINKYNIIYPPIFPGIEFNYFNDNDNDNSSNKLLFIGRLERYKGCDHAIRALALLPKEFSLVVCGDGPEEAGLKELATQLGLSNQIAWKGWVSQEKVIYELRHADIVLMPSKWFEAFGQVGPQAIFYDCAVVAYDSGGIVDWCTPDIGSLVKVGDWNAMAGQVLSWSKKLQDGYIFPAEIKDRWGVDRFSQDIRKFIDGELKGISS